MARYYAIKWTNSFGKRVLYPEKVWKKKSYAKKYAKKLHDERLVHGTKMRYVRIVKIS
jgi:hypothetical protein